MGCLCSIPVPPKPARIGSPCARVSDGGNSCVAINSGHNEQRTLPHTTSGLGGGKPASSVNIGERKKIKIKTRPFKSKRKTNKREETLTPGENVKKTTGDCLHRTGICSDSSSLATADDSGSVSLQSFDYSSNSSEAATVVRGPFQSTKKPIKPSDESLSHLDIRSEGSADDVDSDSSLKMVPRESLESLRLKAQTNPIAAAELKRRLRPKAPRPGQRRTSNTDAICIYHRLIRKELEEAKLMRKETRTHEDGISIASRNEGAVNNIRMRMNSAVGVLSPSGRDENTTHPGEDKAVDTVTQPVNDGVNANERVNVQLGDLILEDIEDVDEANNGRETTLQHNQTTSTTNSNNGKGLDKAAVCVENVQKVLPRQVRVAWEEARAKKGKDGI